MQERGKPPYRVSSGEGKSIAGPEQFSPASTFDEAVNIFVDLTDYGKTNWGQYVIDADGITVLTMKSQSDIELIKKLDSEA